MVLVEIAKTDEVPVGSMKHVEAGGKEILLANVDGKYYAISDRCGHMNALLSMGNLKGDVVTCPFHGSEFDVTTGKKISDPKMEAPPGVEQLPEGFQEYLQRVAELMAPIKTYDQEVYEVTVEGDGLKVNV